MNFMTFHIYIYIGNVIIPTDELIFFRGVAIAPTINCIYIYTIIVGGIGNLYDDHDYDYCITIIILGLVVSVPTIIVTFLILSPQLSPSPSPSSSINNNNHHPHHPYHPHHPHHSPLIFNLLLLSNCCFPTV